MKYSSIILQLVLVALWKEALASPAPNPEGRILTPPPPGSIIPPPTDPQPSQTPSPPPTPSPPATSVPTPTGSTLPGAPIPTSISSPVNSDVRKSSLNIQKNLTTSMNDQGTKLTVQVTSSSSELGFRGDFNLQTEGAPHAGANFYRSQNDTEAFFKFRVGLLKLVELNSGANWNMASSGHIINFANLSSNFWSPISIKDVPNNQNVAIKSISSTFSMRDKEAELLIAAEEAKNANMVAVASEGGSAYPNVTVTFEAYMVNDTVTIDNVTHTPKSLKYGLKISNFLFVHGGSQLAIVKGVYFKKGEETSYSSAASSLSIGGGKGYFNWTNAITLDSLASEVTTGSSITVEDVPDTNPAESMATVVFKAPISNFKNLIWDPEVILEEEKLVESYNQNNAKSGVEKLLSVGSSLVVMTVVSVAMVLLNGF